MTMRPAGLVPPPPRPGAAARVSLTRWPASPASRSSSRRSRTSAAVRPGSTTSVQVQAARELGDRKASHVLATGAQAYASAEPRLPRQISSALRSREAAAAGTPPDRGSSMPRSATSARRACSPGRAAERRYARCMPVRSELRRRRDRRPRRPREDDARRRAALAVGCVPRRTRTSPSACSDTDGPRAREGHHDPREEHGRPLRRDEDQHRRHAGPRRLRRRGRARPARWSTACCCSSTRAKARCRRRASCCARRSRRSSR